MAVKLYYFDGRGLAEPIRWILSYGGIQFEDIRAPVTSFPPPLPAEMKAKSRWGQVPLIEMDGKTLCQSAAICRYFAKKSKLVPADDYEAALCDEYADAVKDLMQGLSPILHEKDEEKQKQMIKETSQNIKTRFLDKFEAILKANGGKYLVGKSLSWADIALTYALQQFGILFSVDLTSDHPAIKALSATVQSAPGIKEWIEKRPKTKF